MGDRGPVILLIEDEPLVRAAVAEMLEDLGFVVAVAGSAREASALLAGPDHPYHAIIIDLGLPDRPGDDLAKDILAGLADVPVIIASGGDPSELDPTLAGNARVAFLSKPYGARGMIELLAGLGVAAAPP
ncbi:MAG: response regulator [Candidatus Kaistia colombiensis]|nr:MAG: response regulator [Kaistia sp.]